MSCWPDLPPALRPSHVYIPGQTARHPEDWFDEIKASIGPDTPLDELHETAAFQTGLAYLSAGYYWECHEVLEAVWMRTNDPSAQRDVVQALIQLANARLKLLMDRPRAARRLCDMVAAHLARCDDSTMILGLRIADLRAALTRTKETTKYDL